jgi:hypothetical protein
MSSGGYQRELDLAPTATIDKVALNNKVRKLHTLIRKDIHVIYLLPFYAKRFSFISV